MIEKAVLRGPKGIARIYRMRDGAYWLGMDKTVGGYRFDADEYNDALLTARELVGLHNV